MASSALAVGTLRHRRWLPRRHAFRYRVFHALLDLDDVERLDRDVWGFAHNRFAVASFHDRDHLGPAVAPVRDKLRRWLNRAGVTLPDGPVLLHTNLRLLGHLFNPVSWFYCYRPDGTLAVVVAEVSNTFGETYGYVLDDLVAHGPHRIEARRAKKFHVSPFLPIDGVDYRFVFRPPVVQPATQPADAPRRGATRAGIGADWQQGRGGSLDGPLAVHMDVERDEQRVFDATLGEHLVPFDTRGLWSALARTPLVTLKTVAAIHWEALRLAVKRVPFHRKPDPPDSGFDHLDVDTPLEQVS